MNKQEHGFTIVELLVVIALVGLIAAGFFNFFKVNLGEYLKLQSDAASSATIASQSQRIVSVLRGTTGIISATNNDFQGYAYFYPSDSYVSLVHYYLSASKTSLLCDVTPMSSNPPVGTPLTTKLRTFKIADNFYQPSGGTLFTYLDASNTALTVPINDLNAIKLIQVNLSVRTSNNGVQTLNLQTELRNRKTNL